MNKSQDWGLSLLLCYKQTLLLLMFLCTPCFPKQFLVLFIFYAYPTISYPFIIIHIENCIFTSKMKLSLILHIILHSNTIPPVDFSIIVLLTHSHCDSLLSYLLRTPLDLNKRDITDFAQSFASCIPNCLTIWSAYWNTACASPHSPLSPNLQVRAGVTVFMG